MAFSGGLSSRVLLRLIEEVCMYIYHVEYSLSLSLIHTQGLSEDVHKKLRFIPHILYIDG